MNILGTLTECLVAYQVGTVQDCRRDSQVLTLSGSTRLPTWRWCSAGCKRSALSDRHGLFVSICEAICIGNEAVPLSFCPSHARGACRFRKYITSRFLGYTSVAQDSKLQGLQRHAHRQIMAMGHRLGQSNKKSI